MSRISAGADESRPGEHERPLAAGRLEQGLVGGNGLGEAIQAVRIVLQDPVIVGSTGGDRLVPNRRAGAGRVDLVGRVVPLRLGEDCAVQAAEPGVTLRVWTGVVLGHAALAGAEIRRFVHVNPQAVHCEQFPESGDLVGPPVHGLRVEEVGEVDHAWPDLSQVGLAVQLDEDILLHAAKVGLVRPVHVDPWVDEDHVLEASAVEFGEEGCHFLGREVDGVESEVLCSVHVIVVGPHDIQRDAGIDVAIDHGCYL
uniref:Uncharacterized protein n=1 Tax=Nymphaea colorata TaxID=210225 RepID=A0A5K0XY94_9MAGN